jgi:threonine synthase
MFYFLFAFKEMKSKGKEIIFSVPSGNFGNICAGIMAQKLGMPARHFIASTNVNDVVPRFMNTQAYDPKASIATISNAMDVGDPSNFIRIRHLYKDNFEELTQNLSSYSFTDKETKEAMVKLYNDFTYVADPHGAVGYLGLKKFQETHPDTYGIFLETAHPVKFLDVVEDTIRENIDLPESIVKVMGKKKKAIKISQYDELKGYLLKK